MGSRLKLQTRLEEVLGSRNVYYQPPDSVQIKYPAIVYSRERIDTVFANNEVYAVEKVYEVIVIDQDPDSEMVDKVSAMPTSKFVRNFTADNLNHDVFLITY